VHQSHLSVVCRHLYILHFVHQCHLSVVFGHLYFLHFVDQSHLSVVCRHLYILHNVHQSHLSVVSRHLYFLHFVHQSHLSFVCWTFVFPTFCASKSFICRLLDICISYILYTKVIYLSFVGHLYFLHFIHQSHLSVVCWTFVFPTCCASKSFICRLLDICISYILYTKVIYLSFFGHFYFLHFVHHSFICRF
jgi:hypothetical protein